MDNKTNYIPLRQLLLKKIKLTKQLIIIMNTQWKDTHSLSVSIKAQIIIESIHWIHYWIHLYKHSNTTTSLLLVEQFKLIWNIEYNNIHISCRHAAWTIETFNTSLNKCKWLHVFLLRSQSLTFRMVQINLPHTKLTTLPRALFLKLFQSMHHANHVDMKCTNSH